MTRPVLVTGISGFLGGHVALQLLQAGYTVRGSVRSKSKAEKVRTTLASAGADLGALEIIELDLLRDEGWVEAAEGCQYLVHTASPFVLVMPKDPAQLINPAVDGTRRAIEAGLEAGVERIVLTSSIAAIVYGHTDYDRVFSEDDWSNLKGPHVNAYIKSKSLAEREAWSIVEAQGKRDRLAVINPGCILGPLLDDDPGTSAEMIVRMLKGGMPAVPGVMLEWVDVRDVAAAHVAPMQAPEAGGNRYILAGNNLTLIEIARIIGAALPEYRSKLPRFQMPRWMLRVLGVFDPSLRGAAAELGPPRRTDKTRAEILLKRKLISAGDAAIATAQSAIERRIV